MAADDKSPHERMIEMTRFAYMRFPKAMTAVLGVGLLSACDPNSMDVDFRSVGKGFDTSSAVTGGTLSRPAPDARGVISYPSYQVALARNGETVQQVADRLGISAQELASYNGLKTGDRLQRNELLALPTKIDNSISAPSGIQTTSLGAPSVDITTMAGNAIDNSPTTISPPANATPAPAAPAGPTPVRHKVVRGETAFIIARQYGVSVRSLGEWNGLDSNFTVREGQVLLIPVSEQTAAARTAASTAVAEKPQSPGNGSPTPTPPSATTPLPKEQTQAASEPVAAPAAPEVKQTAKAGGRLGWPVQGNIVRDYKKGTNEGIDIASSAGTSVKAAEAGTVAAITADANQVPILVVKHAGNLLTVYAYIDDLQVKKGDTVSRGQTIAKVRAGSPAILHFEVRDGFESVDPTDYLN
ncbi:LysM peptidoglycan-binding domain-containing protein [Donghicola sp.]|jgi:murein DD-endopeptidase MepM/ murein hydrolase activator NlpD|uniref:LysM peptidoglycan-binding domain-containing protein n=1 Tax=Donghicola sp. TaxID=1929294 RepID=UPI0025CC219A|nr:LysM peptidoglycan-binding domain-containing protein [Donghicola sp.]MCT4577433.1 peptidoglycan DD-metalloendopeptidase family protein [Donghicola sp.]